MYCSEKLDIQIKLLGYEAVTTSEIAGEYLDRVFLQSSLQRKFGIKANAQSSKAENGIAELHDVLSADRAGQVGVLGYTRVQ